MGLTSNNIPEQSPDTPITEDEALRLVINYTWGNHFAKLNALLQQHQKPDDQEQAPEAKEYLNFVSAFIPNFTLFAHSEQFMKPKDGMVQKKHYSRP